MEARLPSAPFRALSALGQEVVPEPSKQDHRDVRDTHGSVDPTSWLGVVLARFFHHVEHHLSVQSRCVNCGGMDSCRGATVGVSSASESSGKTKVFPCMATRPAESDPRVPARGFFSARRLLIALKQRQRRVRNSTPCTYYRQLQFRVTGSPVRRGRAVSETQIVLLSLPFSEFRCAVERKERALPGPGELLQRFRQPLYQSFKRPGTLGGLILRTVTGVPLTASPCAS